MISDLETYTHVHELYVGGQNRDILLDLRTQKIHHRWNLLERIIKSENPQSPFHFIKHP